MTIKFDMITPEIYMLSETIGESTEAIILSLGDIKLNMDMQGFDMNMDLLCSNFSLYRTTVQLDRISKNSYPIMIVEHVDIEITLLGNEDGKDITFDSNEINATIAYSDLICLLQLYTAWIPILANTTEIESSPIENEVLQDKKDEQEVQPQSSNIKMNIHSHIINFSLINDTFVDFTVPVCNSYIDLKNIVFKVNDHGYQLFADMEEFRASSYNTNHSCWEPIIEPWSVAVSTHQNELNIMSNTPLNVNFHPSVLEGINSTNTFMARNLKLLEDQGLTEVINTPTQSKRDSVIKHVRHNYPFMIKNATGYNIKYAFKGFDEWLNVEDGNIDPLDVTSLQEKEIRFKIDERKFIVVEGINIEKVATLIFPNILPNTPTLRVVVQISNEAGSKLVTIRSEFSIHNCLTTNLDIKLNVNDVKKEQFTISPKSQGYVPLYLMMQEFVIYFRPNSRYEWHRYVKEENFISLTSNDNTEHWACSKIMNEYIDDYATHGFYDYRLKINPVVIVENCFVSKIEFMAVSETGSEYVYPIEATSIEQIIQLPSVERGEINFRVRLDGFDWSDPVSLHKHHKKLSDQWELYMCDETEQKLPFWVDISRRNNITRLVFYSDFWIINHTGLNLYYKKSKDSKKLAPGQRNAPEYNQLGPDQSEWYGNITRPHYYEMEGPQDIFYYGFNKLSLRTEGYSWSKDFGLGVTGDGVIETVDKNGFTFVFSISISFAPGQFWRTKVIRIYPRYFLVNGGEERMYYKQLHSDVENYIDPEQQVPFHWETEYDKRIMIRLESSDWSRPANIEDLGFWNFKLEGSNENIWYPMQIKMMSGKNYVYFGKQNLSLFSIVNNTEYILTCNQEDNTENIVVEGNSDVEFNWEEPQVKKQIMLVHIFNVRDKPTKVNFNKIDDLSSMKIGNGEYASFSVSAEGVKRILTVNIISKQELKAKKKLQEESTPDNWVFNLDISEFGVSIMDKIPQELIYVNFRGIYLRYAESNVDTSIEFKIKHFQVDNQLYLTPYPIVLYSPEEEMNFLHLSLVIDTRYKEIQCFRYFAVQLQEIEIKIDEIFLVHIVDYYSYIMPIIGKYAGSELEMENIMNGEEFSLTTQSNDEGSNVLYYFEMLHLNPIKLSISYEDGFNRDESLESSSIDVALKIGGVVGSIENAPITLNGLVLEHPCSTQDQIVNIIVSHYTRSVLAQSVLILGSADIIGNPVSLVNNLGTGAYSFFHEPAKGIVVSPKEFGLGIAKGTSTLLKNSIYGIFDTASKFTGSVAKGVEKMSFDNDYQRKRTVAKQKKARHAGEGVAFGMRDFGKGVFKGVTGVVTQPVKGAKKDGGTGLVKGIGKGLAGVVVKPTIGAIDLVTRTTEGIKNTTNYFDNNDSGRVRPPRFFSPSRIITTYDPKLAYGQLLLNSIKSGQYHKEYYRYHIYLTEEKCVLISNIHLIVVKESFVLSTHEWEVEHSYLNERIHDAHIDAANGKLILDIYDRHYNIKSHSIKGRVPLLEELITEIKPLIKESLTMRDNVTPAEQRVSLTNRAKSGKLKRKEKRKTLGHTWVERECRLEPFRFIYKHGKDKETAIDLDGAVCFSVQSNSDKYVFALSLDKHNVHYFEAKTERDRQRWIDACIENGAESG
eukprot:TRINITY_DN6427_c0_g2_i1.p1 TRINITY_DN6427_c0_g2~~TRINITY_DN6427_c0_g2_i1.p1  ORF type:complete len:1673 (-),score=349.86 TRINITY_DN6427_c0_g2_i1:65-4918(-)